MQKSNKLYLDDILESINKIEQYLKNQNYQDFKNNSLLSDAVIRNIEIIGEAVKNLSSDLKNDYPEMEWKKIAGLRDIITHAYFGIDLEIIWDIIIHKLPPLKICINKILKENI